MIQKLMQPRRGRTRRSIQALVVLPSPRRCTTLLGFARKSVEKRAKEHACSCCHWPLVGTQVMILVSKPAQQSPHYLVSPRQNMVVSPSAYTLEHHVLFDFRVAKRFLQKPVASADKVLDVIDRLRRASGLCSGCLQEWSQSAAVLFLPGMLWHLLTLDFGVGFRSPPCILSSTSFWTMGCVFSSQRSFPADQTG